jgi:cysteine dioxygenase
LPSHVESTSKQSATHLKRSDGLSLQKLVDLLERQREPAALEQLFAWLGSARFTPAELQPFIGFKDGNYTRHRVYRNDAIEMLVLCWRPGHRTPIHDHNGSQGAVLVQQGVLWETTFEFDDERGLSYKTTYELGPAEVTGAALPDIHQLANPDVSGQNLITVHLYSPPLGVLKTYKLGSQQVDLFTPDDTP